MHASWRTFIVSGAALGCSTLACSNSYEAPPADSGTPGAPEASAPEAAPADSGPTPSADGGPCASFGPHFVLDPGDQKCKKDGTDTNVGAACSATTAALCGTFATASCLDPFADSYPGGYCTIDPCSAVEGHLCPIGSSCAQVNGETPGCFADCKTNADCRGPDYACIDVDPLFTSGASHTMCLRVTFICPNGPADCPTAFPTCVSDDAGAGDGGAGDGGAGEGGPDDASVADSGITPITGPRCH